MATNHGRYSRTLSKLWAASFTAALTLNGASAWAQQPDPATFQPVASAPAAAVPVALQPPVVISQTPAAVALDAVQPLVVVPQTPATAMPTPLMTYVQEAFPAPAEEPGYAVPSFVTAHDHEGEAACRLSDVAPGILPIPDRPALIYEMGKFLSPGFLSKGKELPTGEIVRPSWWVFGTDQFAYQFYNSKWNTQKANELVDRLDIFTQLNLTATERFLVGFRPLDREVDAPPVYSKRKYTEIDFQDGRFLNGTNITPSTLYFEGDFGEIFPGLDLYDSKGLDYGFSVGRQPLLIQDGLLINADMLDAVTVTRNTLNGHGNLNFRATGMFAWDEVHRNNDIYDPSAYLYGVFLESDYKESTVNADFVYVSADHTTGSAAFAGLSAIQRIHAFDTAFNTSFHALVSVPTYEQTTATGQGELLFAQVSMTPHGTPNLIYGSAFWAIDNFSSAARNPEVGGPLGQVGILFASPAIGLYDTPLNNFANHVAGGDLGYQILLDDTRKQLIFEVGGRKDTNGVKQGEIGFGARYQQACGQHTIFLLDAFIDKTEALDVGGGFRAAVIVKF